MFPDNLHSNVIKLTDFGLAKEIEHTTHMSGAGTYPWMAPEVIKSQDFSKKSDVWRCGCVVVCGYWVGICVCMVWVYMCIHISHKMYFFFVHECVFSAMMHALLL